MTQNPMILGGRYEVGDRIGRGGMAEVHIGHDTRLGRQVAIKILRSDLARDASFLTRFRREAQASASLNHVNIVAVYDSGEDSFAEPGGGTVEVPYIVMEFIEGLTLREVLNDEKVLPADEACRIMLGVLSALDYSHSRGIVHRDIKPGNIMVTRGGSVKVMDFGIARALADSGATVTSASNVVGTARYLSPEQAQGETVDARSDLYSAACVLYELLCGRAPFTGEPVSLMYQHIGEQPMPPSTFEDRVPGALDTVVLHGLEKARDKRYQSAADFRQDVQSARVGRSISAEAQTSAMPIMDRTEVATQSTRANKAVAPAPVAPISARPEQPAPDQPPKKNHVRTALWWFAGVVALVSMLGIGYLVSTSGSPATKTQNLPNVVGQQFDAAREQLRDFEVASPEKEFSSEEEGTVLRQSPAAGTMVRTGSRVQLVISKGPEKFSIPDGLQGLTANEAQKRLKEIGFKNIVIATKRKDDTEYKADEVAEVSPSPGTSLRADEEISLTLSSGKITLPNLTGLTRDEAIRVITTSKLPLPNVSMVDVSDEDRVGKVVRTDPRSGEKIDLSHVVTLYIGQKAPDPSPTPTPTPTESEE